MALNLEESIEKQEHGNWFAGSPASRRSGCRWRPCGLRGMTFASDVFATQQNLFNVTRNVAFVAIIAVGMTAVIVTGGIDLSVGAVLVLSGMVIGMAMNDGMSIWLAVPLALGAALLVGAFNGVLIAYVGVPPFVVTLGHVVDRAQPRDGAVGEPDGLRVRAGPAETPVARRRVHRSVGSGARRPSRCRTR